MFALVLAGCAESDAQRADEVCTTFCACTSAAGVPSAIEACVMDDCLPLVREPVSDACMTCVHSHQSTCPSLVMSCTNLCLTQIQTP